MSGLEDLSLYTIYTDTIFNYINVSQNTSSASLNTFFTNFGIRFMYNDNDYVYHNVTTNSIYLKYIYVDSYLDYDIDSNIYTSTFPLKNVYIIDGNISDATGYDDIGSNYLMSSKYNITLNVKKRDTVIISGESTTTRIVKFPGKGLYLENGLCAIIPSLKEVPRMNNVQVNITFHYVHT